MRGRADQLGRIRRRRAGRNEVDARRVERLDVTLASSTWPARKLDEPGASLAMPSARWQLGLPEVDVDQKHARARLGERRGEVQRLTVLPSLAPALVTSSTFGGAPGVENSTAVRSVRNASATGDRGSCSHDQLGAAGPRPRSPSRRRRAGERGRPASGARARSSGSWRARELQQRSPSPRCSSRCRRSTRRRSAAPTPAASPASEAERHQERHVRRARDARAPRRAR